MCVAGCPETASMARSLLVHSPPDVPDLHPHPSSLYASTAVLGLGFRVLGLGIRAFWGLFPCQIRFDKWYAYIQQGNAYRERFTGSYSGLHDRLKGVSAKSKHVQVVDLGFWLVSHRPPTDRKDLEGVSGPGVSNLGVQGSCSGHWFL